MRESYAFTFTTSLSSAELFRRVRAEGSWTWIDRDSDRWGDYVSAIDAPGAIIKLVPGEPAPGMCLVNVELDAGAGDEVRETLVEKILPALDARDVRERDYFE